MQIYKIMISRSIKGNGETEYVYYDHWSKAVKHCFDLGLSPNTVLDTKLSVSWTDGETLAFIDTLEVRS
jgi:hypothetical protein